MNANRNNNNNYKKTPTVGASLVVVVVVVDASGQYPEDLWRAVAIIFGLLFYADQETHRGGAAVGGV